jgi:cytoskeletal protein RodZ
MVHIGDKLREERVNKGYTLEEVSKATKIRVSFLQAIEKGEYKKLPQGTYAHGFVRNYAIFLGLPEHEIVSLFKREYDEEKFLKIMPEGLVKGGDFSLSKFRFTQTLKIISLIFVVLLIYIIFQYRSAIFNPSLSVSSPLDDAVISSRSVTVIGKTDPDVTVFINSEVASLDKDGSFKKTINVFPGKTKITIKSVNHFKKMVTIERHIEVKI